MKGKTAITSPEELDALPVDSVVLDNDGDAWQRHQSGWCCVCAGVRMRDRSAQGLFDQGLTGFRVIYHPEDETGGATFESIDVDRLELLLTEHMSPHCGLCNPEDEIARAVKSWLMGGVA